jgi:diguanylate cyclase (GGDEF)-like protein
VKNNLRGSSVNSFEDRHKSYLRRERLDLLYGSMPLILAANVINCALIAAIFSDLVPAPRVALWCGLMAVLTLFRFVAWLWNRESKSDRPWALIAVAGSAASGLLWGAAGATFYVPGGNLHDIVLGIVIGGMGAGALVSLTPYVWAFYAFLIPAVLPFTVRLALVGSTEHLALAAMCLLYLLSFLAIGWRAHRWLKRSLIVGIENRSLVRTLERRVEKRTAELRTINEQLSRDVADRKRAEAHLSEAVNRQAAVACFGQRVMSGVALESLFTDAASLVADRLHMARVVVLEASADRRALLLRAAAGCASIVEADVPIPFGEGSAGGYALLLDAPVVSEDISREWRFAISPALRDLGATSVAAVLIASDTFTFGVIEAAHTTPRGFSGDDVNFMQSIANMLAAAIDRKRAEQNIRRLALEDTLTGLPNRADFRERLGRQLAAADDSRRQLAVMLLDLDHFKDVNDTLGHPTGDRLLASVATRLRECTAEHSLPARLGGDEFALVLPCAGGPEQAAEAARGLIAAIAEPFLFDGHDIRLGASIGITLFPTDGTNPDDLLRNADLALYRAKESGRNTYEFYAMDMASQVEARKTLERDLRRALEADELQVFYQPQFDLANGTITTVEALLRWPHPTRGLMLPDSFIPVAETSGLIVPLGKWVMEQANWQICSWRRMGLPAVSVAVNLSLSQCRRGGLVGCIERMVAQCGCDLRRLELEVTEQTFLPDEGAECIESLQQLRRLGVTVSIDDFGTGYSSLGRLRGLPVDKVKIDRGFVQGIGRSRDAELIVRAMIVLGRSLGLSVVAEGVETSEQLAFLKAEGCDGAQGFLLSAPLSADECAALLARQPNGCKAAPLDDRQRPRRDGPIERAPLRVIADRSAT